MKFRQSQNESSRINNDDDGMYVKVRLIIGEMEVQYCAL